MKRLILFCSAFIILNSCDYTTGSGNLITEKRQVGNFTGVSVSSSFDVEIRIGAVYDVQVEADDNIIKYIVTTVSGNTLKIKTEGLHNINNAHLKVFITTPALNDINASASADVKVFDVIKSNSKVSFNVSSSADIEAEVEAPAIEADASSSGTIKISGRTKTYAAQASSAGDIKSGGLLSENTEVTVSSGGNAEVYASVNLDANASSGGDITYHGDASVKQNTSSGGSVSKKN